MLRYVLTCCVLAYAVDFASCADREIDRVLAHHRASIEQIHSLHCEITLRHTPPQPWGSTIGEFWWQDGRCRSRTRSGSTTSDASFDSGQVRVLTQNDATKGDASRRGKVTMDELPFAGDVRNVGLLTVSEPKRFRQPVWDVIADGASIIRSGVVEDNGRQLILLKLEHERAEMSIYFDPGVNYLIRRVDQRAKQPTPNGSRTVTMRVLEFAEPAPSIFFPVRIKCESTDTDPIGKFNWEAVVGKIQVNRTVPADALTVRFPPGLLVSDHIRGGMFRTDSSGEPTQAAILPGGTPMKLITKPPVSEAPADRPDQPMVVTSAEPIPTSSYILPASGGVLALGGLVWLIRRKRAGRLPA